MYKCADIHDGVNWQVVTFLWRTNHSRRDTVLLLGSFTCRWLLMTRYHTSCRHVLFTCAKILISPGASRTRLLVLMDTDLFHAWYVTTDFCSLNIDLVVCGLKLQSFVAQVRWQLNDIIQLLSISSSVKRDTNSEQTVGFNFSCEQFKSRVHKHNSFCSFWLSLFALPVLWTNKCKNLDYSSQLPLTVCCLKIGSLWCFKHCVLSPASIICSCILIMYLWIITMIVSSSTSCHGTHSLLTTVYDVHLVSSCNRIKINFTCNPFERWFQFSSFHPITCTKM